MQLSGQQMGCRHEAPYTGELRGARAWPLEYITLGKLLNP